MKILAIDTATEACSVALLYDKNANQENANQENVDVIFDVCPQQHSQRILPMIDELLTKHGIKVAELDAIAYGRGPGSFTGVRIATGIVQGLALGADLPVIEVSTLAAMAQQNFMQHGYTSSKVLIDARMQEVYFGHFVVDTSAVELVVEEKQGEAVLSPEDALARFAELSHDDPLCGIAGTGWEAYEEVLQASQNASAVKVLYPSAEFMLPIAVQALKAGKTISVDDIAPVYLRDKVTWKKLPGR
ncbi:MAG: tRNA threonylcarbamoyladenosine biosynthesis protein TsaB [Glaciecola sp.]|jgi:tRNA threonylcarbamoyladenosine biosynthesis protein TsaB